MYIRVNDVALTLFAIRAPRYIRLRKRAHATAGAPMSTQDPAYSMIASVMRSATKCEWAIGV